MAIVVIKDSEKNNPRFKERRSKRINDQVDIITESELGQLLVQDQAPVSESIQTAINSDRTVVAHFMLGHKKKIYRPEKNSTFKTKSNNEVDYFLPTHLKFPSP